MTCMYPPHMTSVLSMQGSIDEINEVMPYMRFDADLTYTGTHSEKSADGAWKVRRWRLDRKNVLRL